MSPQPAGHSSKGQTSGPILSFPQEKSQVPSKSPGLLESPAPVETPLIETRPCFYAVSPMAPG